MPNALDPLQFQLGLKRYEELVAGSRRGNAASDRDNIAGARLHCENSSLKIPLEDSAPIPDERIDIGNQAWSSAWPWLVARKQKEFRDKEIGERDQRDRDSFGREMLERNLLERSEIREHPTLLEKELRERGLIKHSFRQTHEHFDHVLSHRALSERDLRDEESQFDDRRSADRSAELRDLEIREQEVEDYYRNKSRESGGAFLPSDYGRELRERSLIKEMIDLRNGGSDDASLSYPLSSGGEGGSSNLSVGGSPPLTLPAQYSPDGEWYSPTGSQIATHLPSGSPKAERIFQVRLSQYI